MVQKRQRHHLVVCLGQGHDGYRCRKALQEAAARAKKRSLSAWALSVLMREAGEPLSDEPPTRAEYRELEKRLSWLEAGERLKSE